MCSSSGNPFASSCARVCPTGVFFCIGGFRGTGGFRGVMGLSFSPLIFRTDLLVDLCGAAGSDLAGGFVGEGCEGVTCVGEGKMVEGVLGIVFGRL